MNMGLYRIRRITAVIIARSLIYNPFVVGNDTIKKQTVSEFNARSIFPTLLH